MQARVGEGNGRMRDRSLLTVSLLVFTWNARLFPTPHHHHLQEKGCFSLRNTDCVLDIQSSFLCS